MSKVEAQLAALAGMLPTELKLEWKGLYKSAAPAISPDLLRLGIAYRLQERAYGGLSPKLRRELERPGPGKSCLQLKAGTRLLRSWNGRTVSVLVTETGFELDDRKYRSLSSIAREVTGAAWSGPRFFGLNNG
jgi:hypothetical protein